MTLAVGFFDGVHLGHQRILAGADAVLTFKDHPLRVLDPSRAPALLMDAGERVKLLATVGAKEPRDVHAVRFTRKFATMSPGQFAEYLRGGFPGLDRIHCGGNWRFGSNGSGTPQTLRSLGFSVKVSRYAKCEGAPVSSTRIRAALADGDVDLANAMLGRRYSVYGKIVRGKGVGGRIGSPTLNLDVSPPLRLGVYAVVTRYGRGVANYGVAPTMGDDSWSKPVLEIHLIDVGKGDEIPAKGNVRVEFARFLREERKFDDIRALSRQIAVDITAARLIV